MPFRKHPLTVEREAKNAEALRSQGFNPADAAGFQGILVGPNDPDYNKDSQIANLAFPGFPNLIAYCVGEPDVAWCLSFAQQNAMPFVCRSGGHSTAGFSIIDNGLVIDTSGLNWCFIPPIVVAGAAPVYLLVGPGAQFGSINKFLALYGLHTPGGGCGTVCVGGYMQGGGYGFTSREFGMNCDNVLGFDMMLADGKVVTANAVVNGDLYWAVRGGTGNNFGVLLTISYQLYELPLVWGVWLQWPLENAAAALLEMQNNYMLSGAPGTLGYMTVITLQGSGPVLMMRIMFDGTEAELDAAIAPLLALPGAGPPPNHSLKQQGNYNDINTDLLSKPYEVPPLPSGVLLAEDKQAGYIEQPLQLADWQAIIDYYKTTPNIYNTLVIEPYGGAINAVPVGASAFIHRKAAFDFFVDVFWDITTLGEIEAKNWLDGFMALMQPHFNGHSYQNYPRRGVAGFRDAYWGDAYPTLQQVKAKYDPGNVFKFDQSIGLPDTQLVFHPIGTAADSFLHRPIVYATGSRVAGALPRP
jgi:FAD/FMN-containing dehydrogenase